MKLLRYIQGLRKGKDAHRIERDAMEDPFLTDALEGFDTVDANHTERIERMQRRVAQLSQRDNDTEAVSAASKKAALKSQPAVMAEESLCVDMSDEAVKEAIHIEPQPAEKKRRKLITWLAAAAVLLFVATGGYFWLLREESITPQLAVTTEKSQVNKDITSGEDTMIDASISSELVESNAEMIAQDSRESAAEQRQAVPELIIPFPPTIPSIDNMDEMEILAKVEESIPTEDLDRYLYLDTADSTANFNAFKLRDTSTSNVLAYSKEVDKAQPSGSIVTIKADELGIHSNTNRDALSQSLSGKVAGVQINEKKKAEVAPTQSQTHSQGKIGGKLAEQSKYTTSRVDQRAGAGIAYAPSGTLPAGSVVGRIVDQSGEPIPFATVQVKGTTTGTTTDMEGYFALNAKNAEKLVASFVGFEQVELSADTTKPMLIAMNENSAQLDEVVVVAYGTQKKASYTGASVSIAEDHGSQSPIIPEPEMGYAAYRKYLSDNMLRPTDECADVKGRVVLNFYVNSSGRPYNIEVKRGLCPSADQEAIRLVEEGGRWTVGSGQVRLSVKF